MTFCLDGDLQTRSGRGDGPLDWDNDPATPSTTSPLDINGDAICVDAGSTATLDTSSAGNDVKTDGLVSIGPNGTLDTPAARDDLVRLVAVALWLIVAGAAIRSGRGGRPRSPRRRVQ